MVTIAGLLAEESSGTVEARPGLPGLDIMRGWPGLEEWPLREEEAERNNLYACFVYRDVLFPRVLFAEHLCSNVRFCSFKN